MTTSRTLLGGEELSTVEVFLASTLPSDADNITTTVGPLSEGDIQIQIIRIALAVICIVLIAVAIVGNVIVICAILHTSYLRRLNNYLIVSLSLADLGSAIFCMPFFVMELLSNYTWPLSHAVCALYAAVEISFGLLSVFTLAAISCERVFLITKPMVYQRIVTELRLIGFIIILWVFSFCYGLLQMAWFYTDSYREWSIDNPNKCRYLPTKEYTVFAFIIAFVLPLCIMLGAYMKIFCVVRGQIQRIQPRVHSATDDGFSEDFSTPYPERARSDRVQSIAGLPTIRSRENSLEEETIKEAPSDNKLVLLVDDIGEDVMQIIKCSNSNDKVPMETKVIKDNEVTEEALGVDSAPQQEGITSKDNNIQVGTGATCEVVVTKDNGNTTRPSSEMSAPNSANGNNTGIDTYCENSLEQPTAGDLNSWTSAVCPRGATPSPPGEAADSESDRGEVPPGGRAAKVTITVECPVDDHNPINPADSEQLASTRSSTPLGGVPTSPQTTGVLPESDVLHSGVNDSRTVDLPSPVTDPPDQDSQNPIVNNVSEIQSDITQQGNPTENISNCCGESKEKSIVNNVSDIQSSITPQCNPAESVSVLSNHSSVCSSKVLDEQFLTPEISAENSPPHHQEHLGQGEPSQMPTATLTNEEQQQTESRKIRVLSTTSIDSKKSYSLHSKSSDSPNGCSTPKCSVLKTLTRTPSPNPSTSAQSIIHIAVFPADPCNSTTLGNNEQDDKGHTEEVSRSDFHFSEVTNTNYECHSLYGGEVSEGLSLAPPEGRVRSSSCNEVITHSDSSARGFDSAKKQTPVRRVSSASELPLLEKLRCMKTEPFRLHSVLKKPNSTKSIDKNPCYPLHQKRNSVQFQLYEGAVLESPARADQALRAVLVDDDTTGSSEGNTTETSVSSSHPQKGLTPQRHVSTEDGEEGDTPSHRHTLQWARRHFNINHSAFMTSNASLSTRMNSISRSDTGMSSRWSRRRSSGLFENKAVRMTSYVIGAFVICWVPYQMCMMLRLFSPQLVPDIVWNVTTVIMFMSTAVNPFIYNFYSSQFRAATRKLLRCQTNVTRIHPE